MTPAPALAQKLRAYRWQSWAVTGLMGAFAAALMWREQYDAAIVIFGLVLHRMGAEPAQIAIFSAAMTAASRSGHAAHVAEATREAVRDIADNPAGPGTPGLQDPPEHPL